MAVTRYSFAATCPTSGVRTRRVRRLRVVTDLERRVASVLSIEAIDPVTGDPSSTHIKITFNRAVVDNAALRSLDVYVLSTSTPGAVVPTVLAVAPEDVASPTYVFLTTTEMTEGAAYALTVTNVEAA